MQRSALRTRALAHTLQPATTLPEAFARLGFVQADPIRAPARAQDLILRPRVVDYRVGDLQAWYAGAELDEGYLYAHGYLPRATWDLLRPADPPPVDALSARILAALAETGPARPRDLDAHVGAGKTRNAWGGSSRASSVALERLHRAGRVRVADRVSGTRHYALAPEPPSTPPEARLAALVEVVANVLAPVSQRTLRAIAARLRKRVFPGGDHRAVLDGLVADGRLRVDVVDEVRYLSPPASPPAHAPRAAVLAPFDPLVWDRDRFEHLFGWVYRFEAYTPKAKRIRGYYAMPLLWRDGVVGWVNAVEGDLEVGYQAGKPTDTGFEVALEAELDALRASLQPRARPAPGAVPERPQDKG
jgi:uncharacterized protein YcaQ